MATPPSQLNPSDYAPAVWAAYLAAYAAWQQHPTGPPPPDPPKQGVAGAVGGAVGSAVGSAAAPITDVTGAIAAFTNTVVKLATRLAEAAVGVVLLAIAFNVILKQATGVDVAGTAVRTGRKAATTAAKAAAVAA